MRAASLYRELLKPLLFRLDAETAHHLALSILGSTPGALLRTLFPSHRDGRLERNVFGLVFPNPVGLAAGMDKNAAALPAWEALGFGFVEAGTVTAHAQPGNPRPRLFRLPAQRALINRMGFNNDGARAVATRLQKLRDGGGWPRIPVGLNLGKSKVTPLAEATADYLASFDTLRPFGDYFVLNISSPNTPGLRKLQDKAALDELLRTIQQRNLTPQTPPPPPKGTSSSSAALPVPSPARPLLVKIAPDLTFSQIDEIMELAEAHRLAGIIATNTTLDHSSVPEPLREPGGLSGAPLRERSTEIVRFIAKKSALPVIAVGGIDDGDSACEKLDAGAALIQIYTGFVYRGPALLGEICQALVR